MPKISLAQAKERIEYLIKQAEEGDTDSMRYLADLYSGGDYVPKDYIAAEAWLRKAAELNDDKAKFYLAELLSEGNGIAKNLEEAFDIFHELSFEGYGEAMVKIGEAMKEGIGTPKNEEMGNKYIKYGKMICEDITKDEEKQDKMYDDLIKKKK